MPLYVYRCSNCKFSFEALSATADKAPATKKCPECGYVGFARVFSAPAVHMRGYSKDDARYHRGMKK